MANTTCTPQDLATQAQCLDCLTPQQLLAVIAGLLANAAGGSTDPGVLLDQAKCFTCLSENQLLAIIVNLQCQINGG